MNELAVILRFNPDAEDKFGNLQAEARQCGTFDGSEGWPPHITLGVYENADAAALRAWTEAYAARHVPFKIRFVSLGVISGKASSSETDIIYAVPTFSKGLTSFYYDYHERFDEHSGAIGRFYSMAYGFPAIHASLIICKSDEFHTIFDHLYSAFLPFEVTATALEVYSLPMALLARYELGTMGGTSLTLRGVFLYQV